MLSTSESGGCGFEAEPRFRRGAEECAVVKPFAEVFDLVFASVIFSFERWASFDGPGA